MMQVYEMWSYKSLICTERIERPKRATFLILIHLLVDCMDQGTRFETLVGYRFGQLAEVL